VEAAEDLFAMNRGILRQTGIKLPVTISMVSSEAPSPSLAKHLEKAVLRGGFKKSSWDSRYRLSIRIDGTQVSGYSASLELFDKKGEIETIRYSTPIREPGKNEYYDIARLFGNKVFTVE
jgi:hypothetical protein